MVQANQHFSLLQQSRMEQPQQDDPLFLLRIDEITASVTSAAIAMIDMIVAAFIIQPERLDNQTKPQPRQSRTGIQRRRLPSGHQVRGERY